MILKTRKWKQIEKMIQAEPGLETAQTEIVIFRYFHQPYSSIIWKWLEKLLFFVDLEFEIRGSTRIKDEKRV